MGGSLTGSSGTTIDTSWMGAQPRQGQPLNFDRLLQQGQEASNAMWGQTQGYLSGVENQLRNSDMQRAAQGSMNDARAAYYGLGAAENRLTGLADSLATQAGRAWGDAGPSTIEQTLYNQGERELSLGQALSPEEQRAATQAARSAMAARGLATSNAGTAAEILNRDSFGRARQDARRGFAASANQMLSDNVLKRRQGAAGLSTAAGGLAQGAGSLAGQRGSLALQTAGTYAALDPVAQAYGLAGGMAQNATGAGLDFAGNVASFNVNRQDQLYNNWMNNMAGVSSANAQLASANQANNANMLGSLGGLVGTAAGVAAAPYTGGTSLFWGPALGSSAGYALGR
jgi:hypothetical protein